MTFVELLSSKSVVVVAGSGGVGKTSIAAAAAVTAAVHMECKVLVMTIDPARRLADTLGIEGIGNHAVEVDRADLSVTGIRPKGRLFAAMLDMKQSWDELIERHALDAATAKRILGNPLYRSISERFVQSHDYIAMERLFELHESGEYDLIVIDTPPASHAVDFLDAPARMAEFFDSRLLRFLVAPSRSSLMSMTSKPFLHLADRVLGRRLLEEVGELFVLLESMRPGFIERARHVEELLASEVTTFVAVTTLEPAPRKEAAAFTSEIRRRGLGMGGVVINRALPDYLSSVLGLTAADSLGSARGHLAEAVADGVSEQLHHPEVLESVLHELSANFERFRGLALYEQRQRERLVDSGELLAVIPWFDDDLHDIAGLLRSGEMIWAERESQTREIG